MKSAKALGISILVLTAASVLLSVALLWSVRLNYSGPAHDGTEMVQAVGMRTNLPIFSDEWVVAGYVQKSVERSRAPDFHPLDDAIAPAENPLMPLLSVLAGISRATGVDMVTGFAFYVFAYQLAFVFVFFLFLRACRVSLLSSLLGVMAMLLLPESNVMQGAWIMLPAYLGAVFLLLAFALLPQVDSKRSHAWSAIALIVAGVIYPPYLLAAAAYLVIACLIRPTLSRWVVMASVFATAGIAFLMIMGSHISFSNMMPLFDSFFRLVAHDRFGVSTASVWGYLPIPFYAIGLIGAWAWFASADIRIGPKKKKIMAFCIAFAVASLGLTYGFETEFMIGHQRIVFLSWLILIAMAGFCLDLIFNRLIHIRQTQESRLGQLGPIWTVAVISVLVAIQGALLWAGIYPRLVPWEGVETRRGILFDSVHALPVMKAMLPDDFESLIEWTTSDDGERHRLLAPPYPALAISAATDMSPVSTVDSIVSVQGPSYADFERLQDCDARHAFAKKNHATHLLVHYSKEHLVSGCIDEDDFAILTSIGDRYFMYSVE